jgi:hypothetical protein
MLADRGQATGASDAGGSILLCGSRRGNREAARLFTRHIEAAYTAMCARQQARLALDHIVIPNA